MHIIKSTLVFLSSSTVAYIALSMVFWAFCVSFGHNFTEYLYGYTSSFVLAVCAGVIVTFVPASLHIRP